MDLTHEVTAVAPLLACSSSSRLKIMDSRHRRGGERGREAVVVGVEAMEEGATLADRSVGSG